MRKTKPTFQQLHEVNEMLKEANRLTTYHIAESVKKDIEISELKMEIEKLKTK